MYSIFNYFYTTSPNVMKSSRCTSTYPEFSKDTKICNWSIHMHLYLSKAFQRYQDFEFKHCDLGDFNVRNK